jgi:hypothetical protein
MSAAIPTLSHFSGSVTKRSKKQWLKQLAECLSLSSDGKNEELANRINDHFKEHQELYENPKYQGLISYRREHLGSGKGNKTGKTSSDKDKEDAIEALKAAKPTGYVPSSESMHRVRLIGYGIIRAAKALQQLGTTFDPPGHPRPGSAMARGSKQFGALNENEDNRSDSGKC